MGHCCASSEFFGDDISAAQAKFSDYLLSIDDDLNKEQADALSSTAIKFMKEAGRVGVQWGASKGFNKIVEGWSGKGLKEMKDNKGPKGETNVKKYTVEMTAKTSDKLLEGKFSYPDGKITEFLAERKVIGNRLELTDIAFYPQSSIGNEFKNNFGSHAMLGTLEAIKNYAKTQGFQQVRIQFIRSRGSSSAVPGKMVDKIFDL